MHSYIADNYFDGGARHKPAFNDALDKYVSKYTQRIALMMDIIRYEYTDWKTVSYQGNPFKVYNRGEVSMQRL